MTATATKATNNTNRIKNMRNNSRMAVQVPIGSTLVSSRAEKTLRTKTTTVSAVAAAPAVAVAVAAKEHRITCTSSTQYQQHHQHHRQCQHYNNAVFVLLPLLLMMLDETSALPPIIKIGKFSIY